MIMSSVFKIILAILFINVSICAASTKDVDYALLEKNLKSYEQKINVLKQSIDNSVFNDEEVLLKLDFDADKLISFLQEKFVFQPYIGLLRGVQGTLNSRSGNALDQAVLLAKLLGDAGLDARIANGLLSEALTKQLLSGIARPNIPTHIGQGEAFEKALATISNNINTNNAPIDWKNTETYSRYKNSLKTLEKLLKENNIKLKNTDITQKLIDESKDYFWVEYRMSASEKWKNAHPAFKKGSNIEVEALSYFKGSVPEKYLHQVRIEAFIQQRIGDKYKTHSLMKAWQKPSANLQNTLITYSNIPSGADIKSDFDIEKILTNATYFIPTFNGSPVGGKVFDLKGRLIDSMGMNSQSGALFQTLGNKALSAIDKIEGREDSKSGMQLTAHWLQFTFIHPDGSEYIQKRYIYQAQKNIQTDENTVKTLLMTDYSFVANSGEKSNAYLANVYIDLVQSGLPFLHSSVKKVFNHDQKVSFPNKINRNEFELLSQYYWMHQNPDQNSNNIQFRSQTNLLGFKRGYVDFKTAYLAVDVIANKQEFLQKQGDRLFSNPRNALIQGVWDTACEWLPSQIMGLKGHSIDTLLVTKASVEQGLEFKIFHSTDKDKAAVKNHIDENTVLYDRLLVDINQGYSVAIPTKRPNDLTMTGWWRIHPDTGETLGMIANGGGSEVTEYMIQNAQTALSLIRAVGNLKKCEEKSNDLEKLCCLAEAHFNNVGGLAFGGALGGAIGTAGAAMFDIVDFTVELATGTGIAPSTNGQLCAGIDFPEF